MYSELHFEALRAPRPTPRVIEGWPPPAAHPPPQVRVRRRTALALARLARRIDDRGAWRAFAP